MADLDPQHVLWCRQLFNSLTEGGKWGIPRSGLTFTRRGDTFVLTEIAPTWAADPDMLPEGVTGTDLRNYQERDYEDIKRHFEAAGITVVTEMQDS